MFARHYGPKKIPCLESVKNTSTSQGGGSFTQKSVADYMLRMEEMLCYMSGICPLIADDSTK